MSCVVIGCRRALFTFDKSALLKHGSYFVLAEYDQPSAVDHYLFVATRRSGHLLKARAVISVEAVVETCCIALHVVFWTVKMVNAIALLSESGFGA